VIELIITACLVAEPAKCRDFRFDMRDTPLIQCQMTGWAPATKWSIDNPLWHITGWTCREAKPADHEKDT
jgi:hypothetical protein